MATTIPDSAARSNCTYHAFLSFRGNDVRYVFGDILYHELTKAGLYTFRDEDDIEKGTEFEKKIDKAISESKVAVIIFSKDFASSTYCLDEVAMFMERRKRGQVEVLPVFFEVDPDHVFEVKGTYGVSFEGHEKELKQKFQGEELLKRQGSLAEWRAALRQVAQVTGHVYTKGRYMSNFISDVVSDAKRLADPIILDIPSHVVGKPYRFSVLERWVQNRSHVKRVALLHGAQGIGKKTIAAVVSNQNYKEFDAVVFLDNVADKSKQPDGIVKLQSQLLSRLRMSKGKSNEILSKPEGIEGIKQGLKNKRVLIIIADLDHPQQFLNLVGNPGCIEEGSKVIVTSVYETLLRDHVCKKFPVSPFTPAQSLELFASDAPVKEEQGMVLEALGYCCGNPSNIKALVSCLSSLKREDWNEVLANLKMEIYQINGLKSKFASLPDDDKKLFYDIACFYADRDQDHVNSVLENCHLYNMKGGFERLRKSHWVKVDENNKVTMDQPIRDMGRDMVREKTEVLEERSHIWSPEDAVKLLDKYSPTKEDSMRNNYYTRAKHIRSFILDGKQGRTSSLASDEMKFETEALGRMTELKLLQLVNINLQGDCKHFPKDLVWLSWEGMSVPEMPLNISLQALIILDLRNSNLQELSNEKWSLMRLKILNLSHSRLLKRTPDFTCLQVPALEKLILEDCIYLVKIHSSIKDLRSLIQLSLKGCVSLEELPMLGSSAKILDISGCTGLWATPNGSIKSVKELRADQIAVDQLWIDSAGFSFSALFPSLEKLSLVNCKLSSISRIISDLAELSSLEKLYVGEDLFTHLSAAAIHDKILLRLRT